MDAVNAVPAVFITNRADAMNAVPTIFITHVADAMNAVPTVFITNIVLYKYTTTSSVSSSNSTRIVSNAVQAGRSRRLGGKPGSAPLAR